MSSAAKVGAVMLLALAVLGYFVLKIEDLHFGGPAGKREVKVLFDNVAGLDVKSAVRIAGVRKGTVRDVRVLPNGQAEVTLEVDNDVPLRANASAKVANLGLLGEKYIELDPGTPDQPVMQQEVVRLTGTQPSSIDEVTDQVSAIAGDVKAITASLRQVMAGPAGEQRLIDIVENVRLITSDVRQLIAANRENVDATLINTREITAQLRVEIPRLASSIESVANQLGGTVGENRSEVRELVTNLRGLSSDLRTTAENLNSITGQMKSGEGTIGKLLYDDEAHTRLTSTLESVESGVTSLKNTLGRVDRIGMDLTIKGDYYAGMSSREVEGVSAIGGGQSRTVVGLKLIPNPDKNRFYNIEMADHPRGQRKDKVVVETVLNPATGLSNTEVTTTTKFERNFLLSAQAGWQLDDVSVRIGLFDSSGGIGADVAMSDRLKFSGEIFDFGKRRDDNPHARVYGEWVFRKESEKIPQLFLSSGVDNIMNDTAFLFGGGIRWRDDDLKYLMGSIPVGK